MKKVNLETIDAMPRPVFTDLKSLTETVISCFEQQITEYGLEVVWCHLGDTIGWAVIKREISDERPLGHNHDS